MLPVSSEFQTTVAGDGRRFHGRVIIDYTNPDLDATITPAVSEQAALSYPKQVADGVLDPPAKWFSLDGSCALDGTYRLMPETEEEAYQVQVGWWGSTLAGAGGAFSEPYPTLTLTHTPRPILSLRVVGDSARSEYPVDFEIRLYDEADQLLHTETVTANDQVDWSKTLAAPITRVAKQVLEIRKWSHQGRQVKILEFYTSVQETYQGDDILFLHLLEERDVSQGSLPVGNISANEIDLRLNNIDRRFDAGNVQSPLHNLIKCNRRVRAWVGLEIEGNVEWVPLGVYWTGPWEVSENEAWAHTSGRDRLERLRISQFRTSQVFQDTTLYDLAVVVLEDAGLTLDEYWIDPELQNFAVPYAWFEPISHREALRRIAEASLGQTYCNREGVIRVEGPSYLESITEPVMSLTRDDYRDIDRPHRPEELANVIEVYTNPLRPAAEVEEVYRSNDPVEIGAESTILLTAFYNEPPVIEASARLEGQGANTSIVSATYYAWGADVTVQNTGSSLDTFTLVIDGKPLRILNRERATAEDEASIIEHGRIVFQFPDSTLVQTLAVAQAIANKLLSTAKLSRRDVEIDWWGNPALELGDLIEAPSYLDAGLKQYYVIGQELTYDGGLTAVLKGRLKT